VTEDSRISAAAFSVADSHTHIDMPENAEKPRNGPDFAVGPVWFDAGLIVRRVWDRSVSEARALGAMGLL